MFLVLFQVAIGSILAFETYKLSSLFGFAAYGILLLGIPIEKWLHKMWKVPMPASPVEFEASPLRDEIIGIAEAIGIPNLRVMLVPNRLDTSDAEPESRRPAAISSHGIRYFRRSLRIHIDTVRTVPPGELTAIAAYVLVRGRQVGRKGILKFLVALGLAFYGLIKWMGFIYGGWVDGAKINLNTSTLILTGAAVVYCAFVILPLVIYLTHERRTRLLPDSFQAWSDAAPAGEVREYPDFALAHINFARYLAGQATALPPLLIARRSRELVKAAKTFAGMSEEEFLAAIAERVRDSEPPHADP